MSNILVISPPSIAGTLIMKGFSKAFQDHGCMVLFVDVRELSERILQDFVPDMVFCYDYGQFLYSEAERVVSNLKVPVFHYFGDEPRSSFAQWDLEVEDKIQKTDDVVFCWDRGYSNQLNNEYVYLPLAADPDLYAGENQNGKGTYDITFVGRPYTQKRLSILTHIVKNFPGKLNIFSYEKHFQRSVEEIKTQNLLTESELEDYVSSNRGYLIDEKMLTDVYRKSKINLNITEQGTGSMNYRVFEVLASGGFLLTDHMEDTINSFIDGYDLAVYRDNIELASKIYLYLNNNSVREKISQSGRKKMTQNHTFFLRASVILAKIKEISARV